MPSPKGCEHGEIAGRRRVPEPLPRLRERRRGARRGAQARRRARGGREVRGPGVSRGRLFALLQRAPAAQVRHPAGRRRVAAALGRGRRRRLRRAGTGLRGGGRRRRGPGRPAGPLVPVRAGAALVEVGFNKSDPRLERVRGQGSVYVQILQGGQVALRPRRRPDPLRAERHAALRAVRGRERDVDHGGREGLRQAPQVLRSVVSRRVRRRAQRRDRQADRVFRLVIAGPQGQSRRRVVVRRDQGLVDSGVVGGRLGRESAAGTGVADRRLRRRAVRSRRGAPLHRVGGEGLRGRRDRRARRAGDQHGQADVALARRRVVRELVLGLPAVDPVPAHRRSLRHGQARRV